MPDATPTSTSAPAAAGPVDADLGTLTQEFRGVSDTKLRKVTRLIDQMPERGAAEMLLAPLRDRLAVLRPVRHMNRNRLLFTPFDRVLVPTGRWRPGAALLPRAMLAPVIALLEAPGGASLPTAPPFDAGDPAELLRCGRPLWNAAAAALALPRTPADFTSPGWEERVGLPRSVFLELLPVIALVFRQACALRTLPAPGDPTFEAAVLVLLEDAARIGSLGWSMMLALLLDVAAPELVLRLAGSVGRGDRQALLRIGVDQAVTDLLGRLEQSAQSDRNDPASMLDRLQTRQQLASLGRLENRPGFEQKRIDRLHRSMAAADREVFQQTLSARLQQFELATTSGGQHAADAETAWAIEEDVRRMRIFAQGAGELEDGREYEAMMETAVARLTSNRGEVSVAHLRLVELLAGPDRALQFLSAVRPDARADA